VGRRPPGRRGYIFTTPTGDAGTYAIGPEILEDRATSHSPDCAQVLDKFRAKYGARDVEAYYPKQDVAVEVPLA
jgi:hypothetical protein